MPSEEFMASVLSTDAAAAARGEVELPAEPQVEEPEEIEEEEGEEEAAEESYEDEPEEPSEDDEQESEEEPQAAQEDDGDYGPFQSATELKRGFQETRAFAQEQARARAALERELQEARELLAYQQGRVESAQGDRLPATSDEYREWVEEMVEAGQPDAGLLQVRQYGEETGDWSYARTYTDIWAEEDPYRAASERTFVEMAASLQRSRMAQDEDEEFDGTAYDREAATQVIDEARTFLTQHYPDLRVGSSVLVGAVEQIKQDVRLHQMLRSGVYDDVVWAIEVARERHLARLPRRARASRAARDSVDAEKTALPTGDGVRVNGRRHAVSADVPAEFADAMNVFGNWGMLREE